jgi:hypothetical protein
VVEWQTREFEGLVVEIPCGFKSRPAHHQVIDVSQALAVGLSTEKASAQYQPAISEIQRETSKLSWRGAIAGDEAASRIEPCSREASGS